MPATPSILVIPNGKVSPAPNNSTPTPTATTTEPVKNSPTVSPTPPVELKPSAEKSSIDIPATTVNTGDSTQIKVTVRDDSGKPVPNAAVRLGVESIKGSVAMGPLANAILLQAGGTATLTPTSGQTGPDGTLVATFSSPSPGEYRITATVGGISFSSSGSIKVQSAATQPVTSAQPVAPTPPATPAIPPQAGGFLSWLRGILPLALTALAAILLAVLSMWYLLTRNHMRLIPRKHAVLADGISELPIRVQFVNGLGRPRKQKKGREIDLESTSGEISGVSLPPGRESIDARLKSSKDCGIVTVTARTGKKVVTTDVEFTCGNVRIDLGVAPENIPADGRSTAQIVIGIKDDNGNDVISANDRRIDLSTTLGTVDSPVFIPAKLSTATARLKSGKVGGTAIITATSGMAKSQARVTLGEPEKRYCMHCGARMSLEDQVCGKCGLAPPSGVDTKLCANCNTVLPEAAKFCHKCGAGQPEMKSK